MNDYIFSNDKFEFLNVNRLDLYRSCNCGQAFRWQTLPHDRFGCVIGADYVKAWTEEDKLICQTTGQIAPETLINYFDLERDYKAIEDRMASNDTLKRCIPYASGIRVFNQEPFETLISFIISANNNIKRITRIIENLCTSCGDALKGGSSFAFPTPEAIYNLSVDDLFVIGCGYRAPYLRATAYAILEGFPLYTLAKTDYDTARRQLCKLSGVGPKVADCVLLFSLGYGCAFPMDVWMKRAMRNLFFNGNEPSKTELTNLISSFGNDAGIIQQYIFHYARETSLGTNTAKNNAT